jgi:beta-lactamase regulating signal transducer with metallopeptidase domain
MTWFLAVFLNATLVLALGLAAAALCRRRSAAVRHAILAAAIVCATLMPLFELLLPVIEWQNVGTVLSSGSRLSSDAITATGELTGADMTPEEGLPWLGLFVGAWLTCTLVMLGMLATSLVRLARLRAQCVPVRGRWRDLADELSRECGVRRPVALLQSADATLLVTYGEVAPGILLPAGASEWTDDRRRVVLRHELAHIRRHDAAIQLIAEVLRVMQPINPLVWIACRRLRKESEYACDDAVLAGGVAATDYAAHLLEVATQLSGRHSAWASASAIADPSTLERRIVAMLNTQRSRTALTRTGWLLIALLALAVSLPIAAFGLVQDPPPIPEPIVITPEPIAERAYTTSPLPVRSAKARAALARKQSTVSGQVVDQSGGVLPGVRLTLTDRATQVALTATTNAAGRFTFPNLPAGTYDLTSQLSGFRTITKPVTLTGSGNVQDTITMPIGSLSEEITVTCSTASVSLLDRLFPVLSAQERPVTPIRVGGQVREPRKTRDVRPVCPSSLSSGGTIVRLHGRIGIDGLVAEVTPLKAGSSAQWPADAIDSAIVAVRQWVFTPTTLNGQPVEVDITVTVNFRKSSP